MMTAHDIRQAFLDFFEEHGHRIVPSAPMVIKDDPTLMFTNAGMNQFKDIILGNKEPQYRRAADSQKCLRVSGKHNDLEEVGRDTYHHTMFEMLGNWSFGDYFKREAIEFAWTFLTERLQLPKDRLYVTVFGGSAEEGLSRDDEAAGYWLQYTTEDRIIDGSRKDNFWEMGDTGPCGPCSEIHIDLRSEEERQAVCGRDLVNMDHPLVIEIWNLVFMQYDRKVDGHLEPLPHKVIDTGMGFERLCMAMQGKKSNYDTDLFTPLIRAIETLSGEQYGQNEQVDIAMRVVADHIRTIAFAIADGQLPSNAKAGYVIRRILRRAVRYAYTFLHADEPMLYTLLPTLNEVMGEAYPEIVAQRELIASVIKEEEESFLRTLAQGLKLLESKIQELPDGEKVLSGADAFVLYDTYGFPLDLTELILSERGMTLDHIAFDKLMQEQKSRARQAAAIDAADWEILDEETTESTFVGYETLQIETHILRYRKVADKKRSYYQVVLAETPFYAEMGGQVGDKGVLIAQDGTEYPIIDTKRENNLPVHILSTLPADPKQPFIARVGDELRHLTEANHTATHLMHHALRAVLGTHVEQKGSLVSADLLRFDFSHFKKVTPEEIAEVERLVNAEIRADRPRDEQRNVPIAQAKEMGAMALFGEKYGDEVRVIKYGDSVELCGGTHVASTGQIGFFKIISEGSIAAGIRRIEAVTGPKAEEYVHHLEEQLQLFNERLNNVPDPLKALDRLITESAEQRKAIEQYTKAQAEQIALQALADQTKRGETTIVTVHKPMSSDVAKDVTGTIRERLQGSYLALIGAAEEGKCTLTVILSPDLVDKGLNAGKLIKEVASLIKGGGGGQPHFATAGGRNPEGLQAAIDHIIAQI